MPNVGKSARKTAPNGLQQDQGLNGGSIWWAIILKKTRLFDCEVCDHRVRLGVARCGNCGYPTPLLNRKATYEVLAVVLILGIGAVLVL